MDGLDTGCKNNIVEGAETCDTPDLFGAHAADFFEDRGSTRPRNDHDVVAKKFSIMFIERDVEERQQVISIRLRKEVAEIEDRAFDEESRRPMLEVVVV